MKYPIFCDNLLKIIFSYIPNCANKLKLRLLNKNWRDWKHLESLKRQIFFREHNKDHYKTMLKVVQDGNIEFFQWCFSFEVQYKLKPDEISIKISKQTMVEFINICTDVNMIKFLCLYQDKGYKRIKIYKRNYCVVKGRIYMSLSDRSLGIAALIYAS